MQNVSKEKIWFLGRGFEEYLLMFNLNLPDLAHCRILDCNAGASSFTAQMNHKGYDVIAADVLYGQSAEKMENVSENDFLTLMNAHKDLKNKSNWGFFENHDQMVEYRMKTYQKFFEHYKTGKDTFYIESKLPELPFPDNSFHLVLSSHLLFLYDDRLDYNFHLQSVKEMIRVCSQEVRIYPLVRLRSQKNSEFVDQLIQDISPDYHTEIQKVDYHFREGADEMLRIQKKSGDESRCGLISTDMIKVEGK